MDSTDTDTTNLAPEALEADEQEVNEIPIPDDLDPNGEADNEGEEEEEEEEEELDIDGEPLRLKKSVAEKLQARMMMQADYTRKTQEVAELRRIANVERETAQREAIIHREMGNDLAQLDWIEGHLENLSQINPNQLSPEQKVQYLFERDKLVNARDEIAGRVQEAESELETQQQQFTAHVLRQAVQDLARPDPKLGWNGKFDGAVSQDLTNFALEAGFTLQEVKNTNHPVMIKMLNLAKIGKAALDKQRTATARPSAEPAAKVPTSRASTTRDINKMSMSQYAAFRKQQMR